ncbi:alpha/beta hydrolase family protein [Polaribacter porphyrae]|uniref:Alpha/beta hydrolase n=1 Tax=Polaribacter porphyrae TaxID=1137780 RepID=A0A2S7WM87_9FLAO|nr:alpha/beta hydrolase [Polaribacter porphyrae]PQJ78693.1 alpha/beta hydrolase [Polaribacter porphyrae]
MIRFITNLLLITITITSSFAQIITKEITINNYEIHLPGTLTFTKEKSPLIIWVHGSGGVDRNGNTPQYIKQFRDAVNKKDIAFFSYDKRTANPKNITFIKQDGILIRDFINDVKEVVNHFKDDKRFSKIILAGHSQGSLIAMLALENVDKYISIAGAGETIDKTLIRQVTKQSAEFGKLTENYLKELKETGEIKEVNPNLMSLFAKPNQPFLASWVNLNPTEEIKKVKIPTLIINGDKDLQVQVTDAENLKEAKPDAKLVIIKNMNHLLKDIQKDEDNMKSYMSPDYPISKELITVISNFVLTSKK